MGVCSEAEIVIDDVKRKSRRSVGGGRRGRGGGVGRRGATSTGGSAAGCDDAGSDECGRRNGTGSGR